MAELGSEHTDYAYFAGITVDDEIWTLHKDEPWALRMSKWILIFEKHANHGEMRNVILLSGHVVPMTDTALKERLERTLREARAAGFDAKVWGYAPGEAPRWLDNLHRMPAPAKPEPDRERDAL